MELPRLHAAELGDAGEIILGATEEEEADPNVNLKRKRRKKRRLRTRRKRLDPRAPGATRNDTEPRTRRPGSGHHGHAPEGAVGVARSPGRDSRTEQADTGPEEAEGGAFFIPTTYNADDPSKAAVFDVDAVIDDSDDDDGAKDQKSRILTGAGDDGGDVEGVSFGSSARGRKKAVAIEEVKSAEGKNKTKAKAAEAKRKLAALRRKRRRKNGGEGGGADEEDEEEEDEDELNPRGGPYAELIAHLRRRGPSGLDAEIRALGPWDASTMTDDDAAELGDVLDFFAAEIQSGRNFEFLNALLAHFYECTAELFRRGSRSGSRRRRCGGGQGDVEGGGRPAAGGEVRAGILRRRRGGLSLEVTVTGCSGFFCCPRQGGFALDFPEGAVWPMRAPAPTGRGTSRVDRDMAHALASARALRLCARPIVPKRAQTRRFAVRAGRHPTALFPSFHVDSEWTSAKYRRPIGAQMKGASPGPAADRRPVPPRPRRYGAHPGLRDH